MIWTFHSIYIWKVGLKPLPYYEIVLLITPVFGTAVFPICHNLPKRMPKAWISSTRLLMMKLYAQLCCIAYMQNSIHPDNTFKQDLFALLEAHPNVDVKAMGFPANWREEPLWKD